MLRAPQGRLQLVFLSYTSHSFDIDIRTAWETIGEWKGKAKKKKKKRIQEELCSHPKAFKFPEKSFSFFQTSWYYYSTLSFRSPVKGTASPQKGKENCRWTCQWTGRNAAVWQSLLAEMGGEIPPKPILQAMYFKIFFFPSSRNT